MYREEGKCLECGQPWFSAGLCIRSPNTRGKEGGGETFRTHLEFAGKLILGVSRLFTEDDRLFLIHTEVGLWVMPCPAPRNFLLSELASPP